MGNFFGIFFTPVVYIQNDQRVMGIIFRYVCWGTHRPPPPPRGARRLTTNIYLWSLISWAIFLEFFLHQLCIFKMISVSWGSYLGMYVGVPTDPPPPPPGEPGG